MKQIVRAIQLFTDKLKSYIAVGLIVVLVPSFTIADSVISAASSFVQANAPNTIKMHDTNINRYGVKNLPVLTCPSTYFYMNYRLREFICLDTTH